VKIENTVFSLSLNRQESWLKVIAGTFAERLGHDSYPLRFSIVDLTEEQMLIESTILRFSSQHRYARNLSTIWSRGGRPLRQDRLASFRSYRPESVASSVVLPAMQVP
jgi:hypothetical protein